MFIQTLNPETGELEWAVAGSPEDGTSSDEDGNDDAPDCTAAAQLMSATTYLVGRCRLTSG